MDCDAEKLCATNPLDTVKTVKEWAPISQQKRCTESSRTPNLFKKEENRTKVTQTQNNSKTDLNLILLVVV